MSFNHAQVFVGFKRSSFHVCILEISQSLATVLGGKKKKTLTRECLQFRRLLPEAFHSLQNCSKPVLLSPYLKYLDPECLLWKSQLGWRGVWTGAREHTNK